MPIEPAEAKSIFLRAIELHGPERTAYLESACAGDSALRKRITAMIEANEASGELLARSAGEMLGDDQTQPDATASFARSPASPATEYQTPADPPVPGNALPFLTPPLRPDSL